jgi:HEAT repeat protein
MNPEHLQEVERAIARLKSFQEGAALAVLDVIAFGKEAIPALRGVLFTRERSGLHQARCCAVAALAALGASDVLIDFLETERLVTDPVERAGEDAVINAAAGVLPKAREPRVFALLVRLARSSRLTGVIGALGASGRAEAIPVLVDALEDDASRPVAEAALHRFGKRTERALLNAATTRLPVPERESASSVRKRRSALGLLAEIGVARQSWPILRQLMDDTDVKIAMLACEICFGCASAVERSKAVRRLIDLLAHSDWARRDESERLLISHFAVTRGPITAYLREGPLAGEDAARRRQTEVVLRRIVSRA